MEARLESWQTLFSWFSPQLCFEIFIGYLENDNYSVMSTFTPSNLANVVSSNQKNLFFHRLDPVHDLLQETVV